MLDEDPFTSGEEDEGGQVEDQIDYSSVEEESPNISCNKIEYSVVAHVMEVKRFLKDTSMICNI